MRLGWLRFFSCIMLSIASMFLVYDIIQHNSFWSIGFDIAWMTLNIINLSLFKE